MMSTEDSELAARVADWITRQAQALDIAVTVYPSSTVRNANWLNVPVAVDQDGDAYDRAFMLQSIEDTWDPSAHDGLRLFLMPAKGDDSTKASLTSQVGDLRALQHQVLDRIDHEGANIETFQRLQYLQQDLQKTLDEAARIYPSLKNGVA